MPALLVAEEAAGLLRMSLRTLHELTRTGGVPHRKLPGSRRCLFVSSELEQWMNGAGLEVVELGRGGRIVRPVK
jgi:excisionase family DNA binding protein